MFIQPAGQRIAIIGSGSQLDKQVTRTVGHALLLDIARQQGETVPMTTEAVLVERRSPNRRLKMLSAPTWLNRLRLTSYRYRSPNCLRNTAAFPWCLGGRQTPAMP